MIQVTLKAAKANFFDRAKVIGQMDKQTRHVLNEFGRTVRKFAQSSLIYSEAVSSPGQPPHAHRSHTIRKKWRGSRTAKLRSVSFLREFLFYSYDPNAKSVVIGPVRLNSTVDPGSLKALEYGGSANIIEHGKRKRVTIQARPFMQPAYAKAKPMLPAMWAKSAK